MKKQKKQKRLKLGQLVGYKGRHYTVYEIRTVGKNQIRFGLLPQNARLLYTLDRDKIVVIG